MFISIEPEKTAMEMVELDLFKEDGRIYARLIDTETNEDVKYWLYTWDCRCTME
jgi:hypothetical protein